METESGMVLVDEKHLEKLEKDSYFLNCLRCCGVDNWGGYGDAQDMMENGDEEE